LDLLLVRDKEQQKRSIAEEYYAAAAGHVLGSVMLSVHTECGMVQMWLSTPVPVLSAPVAAAAAAAAAAAQVFSSNMMLSCYRQYV
jgi:hypothetical protein